MVMHVQILFRVAAWSTDPTSKIITGGSQYNVQSWRGTYCVTASDRRMAALANKVALITGAAQGIGLSATRLMLQHGAKVSGRQRHPRVDLGGDCSLVKPCRSTWWT